MLLNAKVMIRQFHLCVVCACVQRESSKEIERAKERRACESERRERAREREVRKSNQRKTREKEARDREGRFHMNWCIIYFVKHMNC